LESSIVYSVRFHGVYCGHSVGGACRASPMSDGIASLFFPIRKQSLREEEQIKPVLDEVLKLYREKHGEDIVVKLLVMDMPNINGIALGRKTIAVSKGLLSVATDEELAAVISHEIGHLHNRDGVLNMTLFAASSPVILVHRVLSGVVEACPKPNMKIGGGKDDDLTDTLIMVAYGLLMAFCAVFLWPCIAALWVMRSVDFATAWPIEYRADKFAADLGYAPALIELFERHRRRRRPRRNRVFEEVYV